MSHPKQLTYDEQLDRIEALGIIVDRSNREKDLSSIENISYYKLKEFATPFNSNMTSDGENIKFKGLSFSNLIKRYYQDKNLRMNILHAIESIEVSLQIQIGYILGEKYGPYGYLSFNNWCDRGIEKFDIEEKQYYFKKGLRRKIRKSNMPDVKYEHNQDKDSFPTIWLATDALTFGDLVSLIDIMSPNNVRQIAKKYDCNAQELKSWLGCLNLVRNVCCHNSDLLDIKFKTKPIVPEFYRDDVLSYKDGFSNGIAIAIFIIVKLMKRINPSYNFKDIRNSFYKVTQDKDDLAESLGFSSVKAIKYIR